MLGRAGVNERMSEEEVFLNQEFYKATYIDDENFYVEVKYRKVEQWAFYLRCIGKWYYPCMDCQRKLKGLLLNAQWSLNPETAKLGLNQNVNKKRNTLYYTFTMPFINQLPYYEFKPCVKCQKQIHTLVEESTTLTIGNKDYEHPVELQRKNEDDDKSFETVAKHKATPEEREHIGERWNRKSISKEEYDKLEVIEEKR